MAISAMSCCLWLLAVVSLFSVVQGGCFHNADVTLKACESGERSGNALYLDAITTVAANEMCSCTIRQNINTDINIFAIPGSTIGCDAQLTYKIGGTEKYIQACLTTQEYTGAVSTTQVMNMDMTGPGVINSCIQIKSTTPESSVTVSCTPKVQIATTDAPPTTTPGPTTQAATTQPPAQTTQTTQTTQAPAQTTQTTQAPAQTTQPPAQTTQPPAQTTQPPAQTTQPPAQTTQPPAQTTQPPAQSTQPPAQSTQPPAQSTQPTGPTTQASTLQALGGFPVAEVAGGVAGFIVLVILLVVCCTCCSSRKRSERKPDEESLRPRGSPEMQERKDGRGYAFDNMLYTASQRDLTGKSITPTVSEGDTEEYQATKGLEELYASVNKTITDSTDIM